MNVRWNIRTALTLCVMLLGGSAMTYAQRGGPPRSGRGGISSGDMMQPRDHSSRMELMHPLPPQHIHTEPVITLPGRWWDDHRTMKTLKLRPEQQQRMDDVFNANKNNLVSLYSNLQHEQQRFVQMPHEDLQDETKVFAQIDRIAQARADLEKANFHFLMQIRKEMDPDQLAALDKAIADADQ